MAEIDFRPFDLADLPELRTLFNRAFDDYIVPIKLDKQSFQQKIIEKTNISLADSIGAWQKEKRVGFIFNSINQYENKKTAYNGGTGVIPAYRGNHLTVRMYEHLIPRLKEKGIEQCVLEVISDNSPALKAYSKVGFRKSKFLHCLKMFGASKYLDSFDDKSITINKVENPSWKDYKSFCEYKASFLDTFSMLSNNIKNESIFEARDNNELIGFIVFNRNMGRIGHIGVHPEHRGKGIGTALIKKIAALQPDKNLYILNVNEKSYGLLNFFLRIGFENDIDQFELRLKLV